MEHPITPAEAIFDKLCQRYPRRIYLPELFVRRNDKWLRLSPKPQETTKYNPLFSQHSQQISFRLNQTDSVVIRFFDNELVTIETTTKMFGPEQFNVTIDLTSPTSIDRLYRQLDYHLQSWKQ